jgi:hypothetical protein
MIYLDSSVALAHLLAEDRFPPDLLWDQQLMSSRLLECEVWNRINAHTLQNSHGDAVRNLIGRVAIFSTNAGRIDGRQHPYSHLQIVFLAVPRYLFLVLFETAYALSDFVAL